MKKFKIICLIFIIFNLLFTSLILIWAFSGIKKYTMQYYHFNPQYIAGNNEVANLIISESMHKLLLMYKRHPSWKFDIFLTGLSLELLKNHTEVLYLLKELVDAKQCEIILGPYSHQFSTAFPSECLYKSLNLSQRLLDECNLTRSSLLAYPEAQIHPGSGSLLTYNYDTFIIIEDVLRYFGISNIKPLMIYNSLGNQIDFLVLPTPPQYALLAEGILPIFPRHINDISYCFGWLYDAEYSNTHLGIETFLRGTPPKPEEFQLNEEKLSYHENRLMKLNNMGFKFLTLSEWKDTCLENDNFLTSQLEKFIPETTWQLKWTKGPQIWMGNNKLSGENDGKIFAQAYKARNFALASESLFKNTSHLFNESFRNHLQNQLDIAWKYTFLAQNSDPTGWGGLPIEFEYAYNNFNKSMEISKTIISEIKNELKIYEKIKIFTSNQTYENSSESGITFNTISNLPINFTIIGANNTINNYSASTNEFNYYLSKIKIKPSSEYKIKFDLNATQILIRPTLFKNEYQILNRANYSNDIYLALSDGLIYSDGYAVIKNNSIHHIAIVWHENELYFQELNQEDTIDIELIFMKCNPNEAIKLANFINRDPIVII